MKDKNSDKQHFVLHIHDYHEDDNEPKNTPEQEEIIPTLPIEEHQDKSIIEELRAIEETLEDRVFSLDETLPKPQIAEEKEENTKIPAPPSKPENSPKEKAKNKKIRLIISDTIRQFIASAIILAIGFFLLNSGAYIELAKYHWERITGKIDNSPLQTLTGDDNLEDLNPDNTLSHAISTLTTATSREMLINRLPALKMEVAPTDNRIIIPRINKNIPIVRTSSRALIDRDWVALEKEIQEALQGGVVHYPGTSIPGDNGNVVITGHSSYFPWDPGRFKDVFALLHEVYEGDQIIVYWEQQKYVYQVTGRKVVLPSEIEVLYPTNSEQLTLITCTPIGTNSKRLIITAEPLNSNAQTLASN